MAPKNKEEGRSLLVTYSRSAIGRAERQKRTIRALGLKKLHDTVRHRDTVEMRAMVDSVRHLVTVEEVAGETPSRRRPGTGEPEARARLADAVAPEEGGTK